MKYDEFFNKPLGRKILEEEAFYIAKHADGIAVSIGCGTGIIEKKVEEISNIKIVGIDIDNKMISAAKKRISVVKADATSLPFKNSSFNAAIFITSLEFIDNYKKAIEEADRILKKRGKLIAILLNTSSLYFKQRYKEGGYIKENIKHLDIEKIIQYIKGKFLIKKENLFKIENNKLIKPGNTVYGIVGIK